MRLTEEQFQDILAKRAPLRPTAKTQHGNAPTPVDGRVFASKREAKRYIQLVQMKAAGEIRGFACQVSIPLPSGKRRMIIDFMLVHNEGSITWEDAKGFATLLWQTKRDELEHALGIKVECV